MQHQNDNHAYSVSEIFLPLIFFAGIKLFYAAALIPIGAGITFIFLEMLRRFALPRIISALYLLWLAFWGALAWILIGLPPYWVLGMHLLLPAAIYAPSAAQRTKPFWFGIKKYSKRRIRELGLALLFAILFAGFLQILGRVVQGPTVWLFAILGLIGFEWARHQIQMRRA